MTERWYPKTAADVLSLPEGSFIEYQQLDCPNCKHTITIPRARKASIKPYAPDMVIMAQDADGIVWMPEIDTDIGWYRRRANI